MVSLLLNAPVLLFHYKEEYAPALPWEKPHPVPEDFQLPPLQSPQNSWKCLWDPCCSVEDLLPGNWSEPWEGGLDCEGHCGPSQLPEVELHTTGWPRSGRWGQPCTTRPEKIGSNNSSQEAPAVWEKFSNYFLSAAGEVPCCPEQHQQHRLTCQPSSETLLLRKVSFESQLFTPKELFLFLNIIWINSRKIDTWWSFSHFLLHFFHFTFFDPVQHSQPLTS